MVCPIETQNIIDTHPKMKEKMMPVILKIRKLIRQKPGKRPSMKKHENNWNR
jgi:hypothetical protein